RSTAAVTATMRPTASMTGRSCASTPALLNSPAWRAPSPLGARSSWPTSAPVGSATDPPKQSTCSSRRSSALATDFETSATIGCAYYCTAESDGTIKSRHHCEVVYHASLRRAHLPGVNDVL